MPVVFFDPGQMTARLDLEAPQAAADGQGGAVAGWVVAASLWAWIEPVSAVIAEQASADMARITHRIWVRFRGDVAAGQRFRQGGRVFLVGLVRDPDETRSDPV